MHTKLTNSEHSVKKDEDDVHKSNNWILLVNGQQSEMSILCHINLQDHQSAE